MLLQMPYLPIILLSYATALPALIITVILMCYCALVSALKICVELSIELRVSHYITLAKPAKLHLRTFLNNVK